jgi:hypothetical protein
MKKLLAAAALLATWYLITPPWSQPGTFNGQASLTIWNKIAYYQTSAACEIDKKEITREMSSGATPEVVKSLSAMQCVSGDDPRFKS